MSPIRILLLTLLLAACSQEADPSDTDEPQRMSALCPVETKTAQDLPAFFGHKSALCDRSGNLWFISAQGLCRYNGRQTAVFSCAQGLDGIVLSLLEDSQGNIWLGTTQGITRYDAGRAARPCNQLTCQHNLALPEDLQAHDAELALSFNRISGMQGEVQVIVLSMAEDAGGNLWFGTAGSGLMRLDHEKTTHACFNRTCDHNLKERTERYDHLQAMAALFNSPKEMANTFVNSIACDHSGNLWFGTYGGVYGYNGTSFNGPAGTGSLAGRVVLGITEDAAGQLWFGTSGNGALRYSAQSVTGFEIVPGLPANNVLSVTQDRKGRLWFGTAGGGAWQYDGKTFSSLPGLEEQYVYSITEDRAGRLWFGTSGGGLLCYDGNSVTVPGMTDSFGSLLTAGARSCVNQGQHSVFRSRAGHLWLGVRGRGLCRYNGRSLFWLSTREGLGDNVVQSIIEDRAGRLWFATPNGVCYYNGKTLGNLTMLDGLSSNEVWSMAEDRAGRLWFGTQAGLCYYDGSAAQAGESSYAAKAITAFKLPAPAANPQNPQRVISLLHDRAGNLWVGTAEDGLYCFNIRKPDDIKHYTIKDGLPDQTITTLMQGKTGQLWLGTGRGLCCYDGKTFICLDPGRGEAAKSVKTLLEDRAGRLWIGTQAGLYRYDGKSFSMFTDKEGLADAEILSLMEDEDGSLWLGAGNGGFYRYNGRTFEQFKGTPEFAVN